LSPADLADLRSAILGLSPADLSDEALA